MDNESPKITQKNTGQGPDLDKPHFTSVEMPLDIRRAFNYVRFTLAYIKEIIVEFGPSPTFGDDRELSIKHIARARESLRKVSVHGGYFQSVAAELAYVSEANACFGSTSAHQAAVNLFCEVKYLFSVGYVKGNYRPNQSPKNDLEADELYLSKCYSVIQTAFRSKAFPDLVALENACTREALKATFLSNQKDPPKKLIQRPGRQPKAIPEVLKPFFDAYSEFEADFGMKNSRPRRSCFEDFVSKKGLKLSLVDAFYKARAAIRKRESRHS